MAYRFSFGAPNVLMMAGPPRTRLPTTRSISRPGLGRAWGVKARTLKQKIDLIREQIYRSERDPFMHELVLRITRGCPDSGSGVADAAEINSIFWFYNNRKNIRYRHDHVALDSYRTCPRTLQFGSGDCDDSAVCVASSLRIIGHDPKLRVIWVGGAPSHIYVVTGLPKLAATPSQWIALDTTLQGSYPGMEVPRSQIDRFKDFGI